MAGQQNSIKQFMYKGARFLYRCITADRVKPVFKAADVFLERHLGSFYDRTLGALKRDLKYGLSAVIADPVSLREARERILWRGEAEREEAELPRISVIVPCYNHEAYLTERLETIYGQTLKPFEVILLDDGSEDGSAAILKRYAARYPGITRLMADGSHTGSAWRQWKRGIDAARGDLIWIAESDDSCGFDFLEKMAGAFQYSSVRVAFAHTVFTENELPAGSVEKYLEDLPLFDLTRSFMVSAYDAVRLGFCTRNMIPNVSGCVFRRPQSIPQEVDDLCSSMRLTFDWVFYLYLLRGGTLAYVREAETTYRMSESGISRRIQKTSVYYKEYIKAAVYAAAHYRVPEDQAKIIRSRLLGHFRLFHPQMDARASAKELDAWCPWEELREAGRRRPPHIAMCLYAFVPGGGELFPIYLANALFRAGCTVTVMDFDQERERSGVRALLNGDIPVVKIGSLDDMYYVIENSGADIFHTHHAYTDEVIGSWMANHSFHARLVMTLHGMYDLMEEAECARHLKVCAPVASAICYVADKNLLPFTHAGYRESEEQREKFVKITNGLEILPSSPVDRRTLGISENDFIFILASRALPEKGWQEAVEAVEMANKSLRATGDREISLVVLGDGEMKTVLEKRAPDKVLFAGEVANVRDYLMMADASLMLSSFRGESYPLVIIESLQSGRPVIATDIGETAEEICDGQGNRAGLLVKLKGGRADVREAAEAMVTMVRDRDLYLRLRESCASASRKFDMDHVCASYREVYARAMAGDGKESDAE